MKQIVCLRQINADKRPIQFYKQIVNTVKNTKCDIIE